MESHATTGRSLSVTLPLLAALLVATAPPARGQSPGAEPATGRGESHRAEVPAAGTPASETLGWRPVGLVRVRDLTPFGILRLDLLPTHAVAARPGTWALEANVSYQNTYVLSDNVEESLRGRGGGRASLSPRDVEDVLALPQDAYFVDGEFGLADLTAHYRLSEHWGVYATVPYYFFDGGFMDRTIEDFHENFGFSPAARDLVRRDRFQVVTRIGDDSLVLPAAPAADFGDPVFGARYSLKRGQGRWNLVLEGAAKLAVGDRDRFSSTGNHDYGLQATWQRFFRGGALYASLAGVYYDAPEDLPSTETWIPTAIVGYEQRLSSRSSAILQLYASPSVVQDTTADELSQDKYQLTVGLQTWRGRTVYRFGLTENLSNFSNTPDIGVTLQVGYVVQGER